MLIDSIQWDDGNLGKCQKHGVSIAEIEFVLTAPTLAVFPDPFPGEERLRGVGRTGEGRFVFVVWTERRVDDVIVLRPISARYMHQKEIDHYERSQNR